MDLRVATRRLHSSAAAAAAIIIAGTVARIAGRHLGAAISSSNKGGIPIHRRLMYL